MERRRSRRTQRKVRKVLRKIKPAWIIKAILYALGIYSFFYSENQFAVTLVSLRTVLIIGIVTGVIASLIIERQLKYYLFSIILLGSLSTAVFFKVNKSFASSKETKITERILYKALVSPKIEHSRVIIDYEGFTKDISIVKEQEYLIGPANFIVLTVRNGGLGYNIITYRELIK